MRYNWKRLAAASLFALAVQFYAPPSFAMPPILPYNEVTEGMQGTAYTVLDTTGEVRTFPVEIVGQMEGGKGSQRMIMARTSGNFIEHVGGVLQGMSGSPIYVDGRLVGALAAGLKDLSPYTFFITPIEDMIPLWSMPDTKNKTRIDTVDVVRAVEERKKAKEKDELRERQKKVGKMTHAEREAEWRDTLAALRGEKTEETSASGAGASEAQKAADDTHDTTADAVQSADKGEKSSTDPVTSSPAAKKEKAHAAEEKSTFFVSGFGSAGLRYLENNMPAGSTFLPLGTVSANTPLPTRYDASLAGGQPVGVAIVYGDFSIGATGTVTAVDGKKVLAFGHSFMHKGNVNYFMTDADVVGTIAGQSNGVKIANIGSVIGRINQDRETGVAGILGTFPTAVPIRIHVKDDALGTEETFGAQIAYDEDFLPVLSGSIAYAAMSRVSDSLGSSTARIRFAIRTNAVDSGGVFERRNMYYSAADVGQVAVTELLQAMNMIVTNPQEESDILDLDVDVELTGGRQTAVLVSAVPDKLVVKPGDTVTFKTKIRPYRKPEEMLSIPYRVPKAQPAGTLNLDIRGGGFVPVNPLAFLAQAGLEIPDDEENEIIIAPGTAPAPSSEKEMKKRMRAAAKASARAAEREEPKRVTLLGDPKKKDDRERFYAPYVIENVIHATLKVEE